jgi:cystine transport system substrate-binding protein
MTEKRLSTQRREMFFAAALVCLGMAVPAGAQAPAQRLRVGLLSNYKPFGFVNAQGQPDGFDLELVRAIARAMRMPIDLHVAGMAVLDRKLAEGEIDVIANQILSTAENRKHYEFIRTFANNRIVCVQHETDQRDFLSLDDFVGKKLGVLEKTDVFEQASQALGKAAIAYKGIEAALADLAARKIDAVLEEVLIAEYFIERDTLPLKIAAPFSATIAAGFIVRKNNTALASRISQALAQTIKDGEFAAISMKWFGRDISKINVSV